jgi:hypothetical protein
MKKLLVLLSSAALIAGCSSSHDNGAGAVGAGQGGADYGTGTNGVDSGTSTNGIGVDTNSLPNTSTNEMNPTPNSGGVGNGGSGAESGGSLGTNDLSGSMTNQVGTNNFH